MTLDQIITLSKAGFTAPQIAALASSETGPVARLPETGSGPVPGPVPTPPNPSPVPNTTSLKSQLQQEVPVQQVIPGVVPAQQTSEDKIADMMQSFMNTLSVKMSEQPPQISTDDVLASIINPPDKEN